MGRNSYPLIFSYIFSETKSKNINIKIGEIIIKKNMKPIDNINTIKITNIVKNKSSNLFNIILTFLKLFFYLLAKLSS